MVSLYGQHAALCGIRILPTRGCRSPYTEGLTSLHEGFEFPTRSKAHPMADGETPHGQSETSQMENYAMLWYNSRRRKEQDMSIMIDLPPAMAQEAQEYVTVRGTTLERMFLDYLKAELDRNREADEVYSYLMQQSGWLPDDYVFDREEANAR